jgi:uncharacterized protein YdhG (YjbR/CyaY superfamily)
MSRKKFNSIEECIQTYPIEVQKLLYNIQNTIKNLVPEAVESIKWDLPTFYYNKKILIQFGAFIKHISIFPGSDIIIKFKPKLQDNFEYGINNIHIPFSKPFPYGLLEELITYKLSRLEKLK